MYDAGIKDLTRKTRKNKNKALKITMEYSAKQIKTISEYQQLYDESPKKINKVFKSNDTPPHSMVSQIDFTTFLQTQKTSHKKFILNNYSTTKQLYQHATTNLIIYNNAHVEFDNIYGKVWTNILLKR